ncbi:MAG: DoxX family protein [Candidatus Korobacteraceae bacterium]
MPQLLALQMALPEPHDDTITMPLRGAMEPQMERAAEPRTADEKTWRASTRVAFRFVFSYFLLYTFPGAVGALGSGMPHNDAYRQMWHAIVPWVGENLLHLHGDMTEVANGSGDQLYDYILLLCLFVVAVVATAIWSWIDRKRKNYDQVYEWLRVFVRLTLAVAMISYGANKLFRMQFPEPSLYRFVDYYGNSSPMGLLWTFMGMSRAYSLFAGIAEMVGGLLLIVPRFTALGALVTFGVMSNVWMLNFCYDVPRKIYSTHLVLMSLFLLLPDIRRLIDFFLRDRPTQPVKVVPLLRDQQLNRWTVFLQLGIGAVALVYCLSDAHMNAIKNNAQLPPPIRGIWSVDEFTVGGVSLPPLLTDKERWQRVIFDAPDVFHFQLMNSEIVNYNLQLNPDTRTLTLASVAEPERKRASFTYEDPDPDHLILDGDFKGRHFKMSLHRTDLEQFLLLNRGLHMINQSVDNR